ncbi:LamG-like jellyroll fold domain-containing protein [Sedimentisphaera salicampi]|uniref:Pectate lyase C n=1 Tax=Sedimentisphaera salicampi TaxID=1941349 RepID=A0A1W6LLM0_9BACT|nr:LamG-like jellyroll fold domain-containing protein [Sedimentisphaera salicampi]ARN56669.1 hypothetical protein STSP1_01058 [Sedimentisphaera salicampi]
MSKFYFCAFAVLLTASAVFCGEIIVNSGDESRSSFPAPSAAFEEFDDGFLPKFEGGSYINAPGEPQIPWKAVTLLVEPDADMSSITASGEVVYSELEGDYSIVPAPPMASSAGNDYNWPEGSDIENRRDQNIYQRDAVFPEEDVRITAKGKLREWKLVEISIPAVKYNPVTGKVSVIAGGRYSVDWINAPQTLSESGFDGSGGPRVKKLAANFDELSPDYDAQIPPSELSKFSEPVKTSSYETLDGPGYAIVTVDQIHEDSEVLDDFIAHKESMGFTVHLIKEAQYGDTEKGRPRFDAIRQYLADNYLSLDLQYVLLIGRPEPATGNVPMLMYDDNIDKFTPEDPSDDIPTDYFYSNLNVQDLQNEDDIYWELSVGRIPYYKVPADLDHILQKTIDYENAQDTDWRAKVLTPVVPLDDKTPVYQFGEQVMENLAEPEGFDTVRVYEEDYGCISPPEFLKDEKKGWKVWRDEPAGLVLWQTHGSKTSAGGIIGTWNVPSLDDSKPGATWQMSCQNAWPENSGNLAYTILKHGGINTVGGSRNLYYHPGERDYTDRNDNVYQYGKNVLSGMSCGISKDDSLRYGIEANQKRTTMYGDPSVVVYSDLPDMMITPVEDVWVRAGEYGSGISFSLMNTTEDNNTFDWFSEGTVEYTLMNTSDAAYNWTAQSDQSWLNLNNTSGTVDAGGDFVLSASLDSNAPQMSEGGIYYAVVTITDTTNNKTSERKIRVDMQEPALVGHWKFDENSGALAADSGTGDNDAVLNNMDTVNCWTQGFYKGAVELDGTDDFADITGLELYSTDTVTITSWIRPTGVNSGVKGILMNRNGNAIGMHLSGNQLRYHWDGQGSWDQNTGLNLAQDEWSFGAVVIEPDKATLYKYTASGGWESWVNTREHTPNTFNGRTVIGRDDMEDRFFEGQLDDTRIYNYSLNYDQIKSAALSNIAVNPDPENGFQNAELNVELKWECPLPGEAYDVYLSPSESEVQNAGLSSDCYLGRVSGMSFPVPERLSPFVDYYWRVDTVEDGQPTVQGTVWNFKTNDKLRFYLEAEDADTLSYPMVVIQDESASGGAYVTPAAGTGSTAAPPEEGWAEYDFSVESEGEVKFVLTVRPTETGGSTADNDAFWIDITGDDEQPELWESNADSLYWDVMLCKSKVLSPGDYTFRVGAAEDGFHLDKVRIVYAGVGDSTAPPAVTGFDVQVSGSSVSLGWDSSPAPDLDQYRIYKSSSPDEGFSFFAGGFKVTSVIDYLSTSGEHAYYYIEAVDTSGNVSPQSEIVSTVYSYGGGEGTAKNPYILENAQHIQELSMRAADYDKSFILANDIDCGSISGFSPIGSQEAAFEGTFNGQGSRLYGLQYDAGYSDNIGFFGKIGSGGEVKNLALDVYFQSSGGSVAGILAGINQGAIDSCVVRGVVSQPYSTVGGIAGLNQGIISNCRVDAFLFAVQDAGGITADNTGGLIQNCLFAGSLNASNTYGIAGAGAAENVDASFYGTESSGAAQSFGGEGRLDSELTEKATYSAWDFACTDSDGTNDKWYLCTGCGEMPILEWQRDGLDFLCPEGVGITEFGVFASSWMLSGSSPEFEPDFDLNSDGIIDESDLVILADYWLTSGQ